MPRYFVVAESFAAPMVSDTSMQFQGGPTPEEALESFVAAYKHPCGVYAAVLYADANAYHDGEKPLAKWLCNHEQAKQRASQGKDAYSYRGHGPGTMEIDGKVITVDDPRGGCLV